MSLDPLLNAAPQIQLPAYAARRHAIHRHRIAMISIFIRARLWGPEFSPSCRAG